MRRRSDNQERAVLVKDVMKREVATVGPEASVSLAARLIRDQPQGCNAAERANTESQRFGWTLPHR
jgi:hypothetical protein